MKIRINDVLYSYNICGEGEPLLLLHGFTGSKNTWNECIECWSQSFQVITIDLLGHGETESPKDPKRYQMEQACLDLKTLLDQLEIKSVNLLGYSMGGRLALSFACLYPQYVNLLLLESTSPGLKTESERVERIKNDQKLADMIQKKGLLTFINYWERIPLFESQNKLPEHIRQKVRLERENQNPLGLINSLLGMGTGMQPSWWDNLSNLKLPVLILVGELDEKFYKIGLEMEKLLPNASLVKFNGAGHAIHLEQAEKFGTIVKEFIKGGKVND